jgi:hypothetical protein
MKGGQRYALCDILDASPGRDVRAGCGGAGSPQDHRWAQARRLLAEGTLPTTDRVAGLLVLLFAQQASRIARLTRSHIHHRDDELTELSLAATNIVLPCPLADLINQLPTPRSDGTARRLQLPPPVIGGLLGLTPGTVDRWATISGERWARYSNAVVNSQAVESSGPELPQLVDICALVPAGFKPDHSRRRPSCVSGI